MADLNARAREARRLAPDRDLRHDIKENYEPFATLVWSPQPGVQLWLGGQQCADHASELRRRGIRAKMCLAGTESRSLEQHRPAPLFSLPGLASTN